MKRMPFAVWAPLIVLPILWGPRLLGWSDDVIQLGIVAAFFLIGIQVGSLVWQVWEAGK